MAISSENNRNDYTGNGATSSYDYTYRITSQSHLLVTVKNTSGVESTLTLTTDYTVSGVGADGGGSIALVNSGQSWLTSGNLITDYTITIRRVVDITQETDIRNQGDFYPEVHEDQFDYMTFIDQQQQDEIDRAVKLPESIPSSTFDPTLPTGITTGSLAIVINSAGTAFETGPTTTEISNAQTYATNAAASATLASQWATKVDGIVNSTDYSAKAWAIGGTDVTETASRGAAKEWATKTDNPVDTSEYSAKEYAQGTQTRGASGGGSAKDWAQYTGGTVDDTEYSAKYYANQAATSASEAATSAAASQWSDVVYVTNADSPVSVVDADAGTLYSVDTSGGAVVFNLPGISGLTLSGPWSIGIKKTNSSANNITVNRDGTDTIGGATSFTIDRQYEGASFIPDTDGTPDDWTTLSFGEVPITGDIVGTTDTQDLSAKTFTDAITLEEQSGTPSTPSSGDKKFYAKNDGKLYTLDDAGNEIEVGSGSGGGGVTYINDDAEAGVTNLVAYADAAATTPDDATGGSPNITVTEETGSPLVGSKSFLITKDAANRQGEGVAIVSETIDEAYQNSVHTFEFLWKPDATFVADELKLFVYHPSTDLVEALNFRTELGEYTNSLPDDNSRVHRLVGEIAPRDTTYKIVAHIAGTSTTAWTALMDNIQSGPQRLLNGVYQNSATLDLASSGDFTAGTLLVERVGNTVTVTQSGDLTHASATSADSASGFIPSWARPSTTANNQSRGDTRIDSLSDGTFRMSYDSAQTGETTISSLVYNVSDDIQATNVLNSTQIDHQVVKAIYTVSASTANSSIADASEETVDFDMKVKDTHNTVTTGASWLFTAPVAREYTISCQIKWSNTANMDRAVVNIHKNGAFDHTLSDILTTVQALGGSIGVYLEQGDTIEIKAFQDDSGGSARSIRTDGTCRISIIGEPDFSVIGALRGKKLVESEVTAASYGGAADQWYDLTSIELDPGEWDIHSVVGYISSGVTTTDRIYAGLGTTSGNNNPDLGGSASDGINRLRDRMDNSSGGGKSFTLPFKGLILTETTTVYLKVFAETSVTNLQAGGKIQARLF